MKIDANENPMGPCPEAIEAINAIVAKGGRYLYGETGKFVSTLAGVEGLSSDHVAPFAGSSEPLHRAVMAFASPNRCLVTADPGYEAAGRAARFIGAKVITVPLRKDGSHDVKAMAEADPAAGVIYVCNPNNPTGTVTKKADIDYLVAHKPEGTILLLDEAYIHLSSTAEPGTPHVNADKDVVILRTFSKLFGHGRPPSRRRLRPARPAREDQGPRRRCLARHRDGRRDGEPQRQGPRRVPPQGHRRRPHRDGRVARQEGLRLPAVGGEYDHDSTSASPAGRSPRP